MRKLGFAIKVVSDGVYEPLVCNNGSWLKKVIDPRHYLRMFSGLVGTENVVTAMSFSEYGCYIMLLRDIPGHAGDCLSAWLFIPCNIAIEDSQVREAYQYAKSVLFQSSLAAVMDEANNFFDREYPVKKISNTYSPSIGEKLGLRYVNDEVEFFDLIGKKRYQEYYSQFKAVFILDRNAEVKVNTEGALSFGDLTKQPLNEYCILVPPTERDLSEMGQGTKVIFRKGRTFDTTITIKKGSRVELVARRSGFDEIPLEPIMIDEDVMQFPHLGRLKWKKKISKDFFDIRNYDGIKIEVEKLVVAGYDITNHSVPLLEEECRNAKVIISARKYEPYESTVDFLSIQERLKVTLHRVEGKSVCKIVLANGKEADMTLKSKYLDGLGESPLEGYTFVDGVLCTSLGYKLKYWFFGILTVIVLVLAYVGINAMDAWSDTHNFKWGLPPWEEITCPTDSSDVDSVKYMETPDSAAVAYLSNNGKWKKDSLEKYAVTQNLYTQLINYQFEDLKNTTIDSCNRYNEIKSVAEQASSMAIRMSEKYPDDGTITIESWIKKVRHEIDKANTNDGFTEVEDEKSSNTQGSLARKVSEKQNKQAKSTQKGTDNVKGSVAKSGNAAKKIDKKGKNESTKSVSNKEF